MMTIARSSLRFAVVCLLVCFAASAYADAAAEARKAIQAAYDRNTAAANKKDVAGSLTIYTPDFVSIEKSGKKTDLKQTRDQMKMVFNMTKTFKLTQTVQSFQLKGNQAQVTVKAHLDGTIPDPQNKASHRLLGDIVSNDTWVKTARGWLLKQSTTVSEKNTMDGKPLPGN